MTAEIRQLKVEDYRLLPSERKTGLSNYYVREMEHGSGRLFGLVDEDGKILSYAVFNQDGRFCSVSYMETDEPLRGKGLAAELLSAVMNADDTVYFLHISTSFPTCKAVLKIAQKTGFYLSGQSTIYSAEIGDALWKKYDRVKFGQKGRHQLEQGGECLSFSELSEEQLGQLEDSCGSEFKNQLDPVPLLKNEAKALDRDLSFAYFKDGELIAYTLVTRPRPNSVAFEQISTTENLIGHGAVVVPLIRTMQEIRRRPEISQMNMTIYNNNYRSRRFVLHLLDGIRMTQVTNYSFLYQRRPLK